MQANKIREYIKKTVKKRTDTNIDLKYIGSEYNQNNKHYHGFFGVMHSKEEERKFLRKELKLAKDSQVIYEFIQNARDANATNFYIYYDKNNFVAINNGKKFTTKDISSILDIGQSAKEENDHNIGSFGVGFKIIHRLVGNGDGLTEIVDEYKGPILFSWDKNYVNSFLNKDLKNIDKHWLFKILYTCFPAGFNEKIYDKDLREGIFFTDTELKEMREFIQSHNATISNLKEGSLFFLKLGSEKFDILEKEKKLLDEGLQYSLTLLNADKNSQIENITLNNKKISKKNMLSVSLMDGDTILLFHENDNERIEFFNKGNDRVSFFTFFPMSDQKDNLNFVIHSSKFDYKSDRRQLTEDNKKILQTITQSFIDYLNRNKHTNEYLTILKDLYLSNLNDINQNQIVDSLLKKDLLEYLKSNIPYKFGKTSLKTTSDKFKVIVVDTKLKDIPLKDKYHFYFNPQEHKNVVQEAIRKLDIQRCSIVQVMVQDNINNWILKLKDSDFTILLEEIKNKKSSYSKDIINIWKSEYTLKQIKRILKIFSFLDKEQITFAIIKNDKNNYEIDPTDKNRYIKYHDFKEFLEKTYETNDWYLIPDELEEDIVKIIRKNSKDEELLDVLLKSGQHREIIEFVEYYQYEKKFLDTLKSLNFDTTVKYSDNCYEYKVLDIALKNIDNFSIESIRDKILFDDEPLNRSLISNRVTFKYGIITNPINYDNKISREISELIDNIDSKYKDFFELREENKEKVYSYIKDEIYSKHYLNNQINTKNRLKFILYYSLEEGKNYFDDFNGVNIYQNDSYDIIYKLLKGIGEKHLKKAPFTISDLFPETLGKSYYIQDEEYSIQTERLPSNFEEKYSKFFKLLGLKINDELANLRKDILNKNQVDWSKVRKLETEEIINTIKYIAYQKKEYKNSHKETEVLKNIFKALSQDEKIHLEYLPCMKNLSTVVLKKINPYGIYCITKERIESKNKFFRERLSKDIKNRDIIYLDILDLDTVPYDWKDIKENEDELNKDESLKINKEKSELQAVIQDVTEYNDYTAEIGKLGELFAKELLNEKFGVSNVKYNNEEKENETIDFYITDGYGEKYGVEVKATVSSPNSTKGINFILSTKQFRKFQDYDKKTYLIFVVGVKLDNPEILVMHFDNEWLDNR